MRLVRDRRKKESELEMRRPERRFKAPENAGVVLGVLEKGNSAVLQREGQECSELKQGQTVKIGNRWATVGYLIGADSVLVVDDLDVQHVVLQSEVRVPDLACVTETGPVRLQGGEVLPKRRSWSCVDCNQPVAEGSTRCRPCHNLSMASRRNDHTPPRGYDIVINPITAPHLRKPVA